MVATRDLPETRLTPRDTAKFTALVAFAAIFVDAALGHGLAWENDPYWTYWITKTFLIATVFGLGTAWAGIGKARGAIITAVHTVVLTVYYWTLAPVGLPSSPEWLDLEHTWLTGIPIHFGVIYVGYLLALWIWRRRNDRERDDASAGLATLALIVSIVIVLVAGALSSLAVVDFPGVTWFVTRLLVTFAFVYGWWTIVGRDPTANVVGGTVLAFVWATYAHFLAPSGLPDLPLRIIDSAPPAAEVEWMSFREIWLVSLPIHVAVMIAALVLASDRRAARGRATVRAAAPVLVAAAVLGAFSFVDDVKNPARTGTVTASGPVEVRFGSPDSAPTTGTGDITVEVEDVGARVSPLPPHDHVILRATVRAGQRTYSITADDAMVEDPLGHHTTWWGVGFEKWHHGRSGIGSRDLPAIRSKMALFALGRLQQQGRPAEQVPVHFMTVDDALPGVGAALQVGTENLRVDGLSGGILNVSWSDYTGDLDTNKGAETYGFGTFVLALFLLALLLARDGQPPVADATPPERIEPPEADARTRGSTGKKTTRKKTKPARRRS